MLSGCCFCFTNADFAEPQCPTPIHTTPRNTHLIHVGLRSTGLAPLMCAHKSMIWNVCGDLSSCLNSPPFSWPFPLCYLCPHMQGSYKPWRERSKINPKCLGLQMARNLSAPSLCPASRTKKEIVKSLRSSEMNTQS